MCFPITFLCLRNVNKITIIPTPLQIGNLLKTWIKSYVQICLHFHGPNTKWLLANYIIVIFILRTSNECNYLLCIFKWFFWLVSWTWTKINFFFSFLFSSSFSYKHNCWNFSYKTLKWFRRCHLPHVCPHLLSLDLSIHDQWTGGLI